MYQIKDILVLFPHISECLPVEFLLYKRFIKYFISGVNHRNESVRNIFRSSLYHFSRLSNNFRFIAQMCNTGILGAEYLEISKCVNAIHNKFNETIQICDILT